MLRRSARIARPFDPSKRVVTLLRLLPALWLLVVAALLLELGRALLTTSPPRPTPDVDVAMLVEAAAGERIIEGRLRGFPHHALRRRAPDAAVPLRAKMRAALAASQQALNADPTARRLHVQGLALLLLGDSRQLRDAVAALERAAALDPRNASYQSDLAAAYIESAAVLDQPVYLAAGVDAASRAHLLDTASKEAQFNRALALERLGFHQAAARAWGAYRASGPGDAWSSEAAARLAFLQSAASHGAAGAAPRQSTGCVRELSSLFEQGLMGELRHALERCSTADRTGQPAILRFFEAVSAYYDGRLMDAERIVDEALQRREVEVGVRARLFYLRSGLLFARGRFEPALVASGEARGLMGQAGNVEGLASAHQMTAEILSTLGERDEAWRHYAHAVALADAATPGIRRHALLNSIALAGLAQGWPLLSIEALDYGEGNVVGPAAAAQRTELSLNRARAWRQAGARDRAIEEVERAQAHLETATDSAIKDRLNAELQTARAEVLLEASPAEARRAAAAAREQYLRLGMAFKQATASLLLARADRSLNQAATARADLLMGIEAVESERAALEQRRRRVSYLDVVWDLYRDYADLAIAEGDDRAALQMLERGRARQMMNEAAPDLTSLMRALSPDTMVLVFFEGSSHLTRWVITRETVEFSRTSMAPLELARLVADAQLRVRDDNSPGDPTLLDRALFGGLSPRLASIARIVIVPDGSLSDAPFPLARAPETGRPFIERVSLAVAPSLQLHLLAEQRAARSPTDASLVAFAPTVPADSGLPPLPNARRESEALVRLYSRAELVVGASATAERLTRALRDVSVVHFAGHAVLDRADPWGSRLIVAPSAGNRRGVWMPATGSSELQINAVPVLAACATAAGRRARGTGAVSIAASLLAAGAPGVIATLEDIDDVGGVPFFVRVHEELSRGRRPSEAVRAAQMSSARRDWRNWSSVVALGR